MIGATGTFKFSPEGVRTKIGGASRRAQFLLDQQVAKDSNYYCPEDLGYSGGLMGSVEPSATEGKGVLVWNEPYAAAQYYDLPNKSKDKNPNARMKWFEAAKAVCKKKWERVAQRGFTN